MAYIKKKKTTFPKAYNKKLGLVDIGGVGEIIYKSIRYKEYDYDDQANIVDHKIKGAIIYPLDSYETPYLDLELGLTGKKLLVSLCDLAEKINFEDGGTTLYPYLIKDWCKTYFHPYNIDVLYEKYRALERGETDRKYYPSWFDGVFKVDDFMNDLADIYQKFTFICAFLECLNGNPEPAFNHMRFGRYFDTLPYFENYKSTFKTKGDSTYNPYDFEAMNRMAKSSEMHINTIKEFQKEVVSNKFEIYKMITDWIPEIKVGVQYDSSKNTCVLAAEVNSIFDICYYTIARLLASNAPSEDENTDRIAKYDLGEKVSFCEICGKVYIKSGNNQRSCGKESCKREIDRRRQERHRLKLKNEDI